MKKLILIAVASLFTLGVMAQTPPYSAGSASNPKSGSSVSASKSNPKKSKTMKSKSHNNAGPSTSKKKKGS